MTRSRLQRQKSSLPGLFWKGSTNAFFLVSLTLLLIALSPVASKNFETKSDCDSVLQDGFFKRNGTSKYLYPANWSIETNVTARTGNNTAEKICGSYGLKMPSAYNMRDWTSLQDIGRDYFANVPKVPFLRQPFFLGERFVDNKLVDENGDESETFVLWNYGEPNGGATDIVLSFGTTVEGERVLMGANDETDLVDWKYKELRGLAGKVVCMYPKGSFCFTESSENELVKNDTFLKEPYFLGQVAESYYLWAILHPRFARKAVLDKECKKPEGWKPESVEWLSDFSNITEFKDELAVLMRDLQTKLLQSMDLHPNLEFGTSSKHEVAYWETKDSMIHVRNHSHDSYIPYFALCIYRFPTETCG